MAGICATSPAGEKHRSPVELDPGVRPGPLARPVHDLLQPGRAGLILPALLGLTFGAVGWTMVITWIYNSTESTWLIILHHGWNNAVQSYLVLSQTNAVVQILFGVLPWAIAIYLSKKVRRRGPVGSSPAQVVTTTGSWGERKS